MHGTSSARYANHSSLSAHLSGVTTGNTTTCEPTNITSGCQDIRNQQLGSISVSQWQAAKNLFNFSGYGTGYLGTDGSRDPLVTGTYEVGNNDNLLNLSNIITTHSGNALLLQVLRKAMFFSWLPGNYPGSGVPNNNTILLIPKRGSKVGGTSTIKAIRSIGDSPRSRRYLVSRRMLPSDRQRDGTKLSQFVHSAPSPRPATTATKRGMGASSRDSRLRGLGMAEWSAPAGRWSHTYAAWGTGNLAR